ncbi:MAG TPA: DUF4382 domain-containing protein [Burkholderiaceae bacterium]|nr:DUF4382 domain-containing protein [Burkholderiaceae bacterium]
MNRSLRFLPALAAAAVVAACGGGGGDAGGTGTLSVKLTDAPACGYDNVWVTVTKVRVHRSDTASDTDPGWSELVVTPDPGRDGRRIDLLSLQNGVLADLGQTALPAGRYSQVRLVLSEAQGANQLVLTGDATRTPISLDTPSAQQSGLKLKHGFEVAAGTEVDLVLDFDACKSIVKAGNSGKYNLKPVVSVFPVLVGTIAGAVDPAAARAEASVSLQRFDPASGTVSVIRATSVRADGTWTLSPVPVSPTSGPGYNLVIGSRGYANVVYTNVPVVTAAVTNVPTVSLTTTNARSIEGVVATAAGTGSAQALQKVVDNADDNLDVVIQAAFANADAVNGDYLLSVPSGAARVAPFGGALAGAANAGKYVVRATDGVTTQDSATVDVSAANVSGVNFAF